MYCIHDIESKMYQTHNYFAEIAMYLPWGLTINYQLYTGDIVQLNDHDLKFVTYKIEYENTHTHTQMFIFPILMRKKKRYSFLQRFSFQLLSSHLAYRSKHT
jgi:hypothetical protein